MDQLNNNQFELIKKINNTLWIIYKQFLDEFDMAAVNNQLLSLSYEIRKTKDKQAMQFLESCIIAYTPVLNELLEMKNNNKSEVE